jgi:hypothetical protein
MAKYVVQSNIRYKGKRWPKGSVVEMSAEVAKTVRKGNIVPEEPAADDESKGKKSGK